MTTSRKATLESGQKQTLASTTDSTTTYHCNGDSRIQFTNQKLHHVDIYSPNELQDQPPEPQQTSAWNWYTDNSLQNNLRNQQTVLHKWLALRWSPGLVKPQQQICHQRKQFIFCQGKCCGNFLELWRLRQCRPKNDCTCFYFGEIQTHSWLTE